MKKIEYISPETVVIAMRQYAHLLSGSKAVSGLNDLNNVGINWDGDGFEDNEFDL